MTQGIYTAQGDRFPTKKALKDALKNGEDCSLEATSILSNEYGGSVRRAPAGDYFVVGPSPTKRNWYAHINVTRDGGITIK